MLHFFLFICLHFPNNYIVYYVHLYRNHVMFGTVLTKVHTYVTQLYLILYIK